jgi:hypothetical protein
VKNKAHYEAEGRALARADKSPGFREFWKDQGWRQDAFVKGYNDEMQVMRQEHDRAAEPPTEELGTRLWHWELAEGFASIKVGQEVRAVRGPFAGERFRVTHTLSNRFDQFVFGWPLPSAGK